MTLLAGKLINYLNHRMYLKEIDEMTRVLNLIEEKLFSEYPIYYNIFTYYIRHELDINSNSLSVDFLHNVHILDDFSTEAKELILSCITEHHSSISE